MPVRKFRSIEEMNAFDRQKSLHMDVARRMFAVWEMTRGIARPLNFPKGVHKFRSIEEMHAFKERYEQERIAAIKAERMVK